MSQQLIWTQRDELALQRRFELLFACSPDPPQTARQLSCLFREYVQLYPVEWPRSALPPFEETWSFGQVSVRYRLIPDSQTVEVLGISGPQGTIPNDSAEKRN